MRRAALLVTGAAGLVALLAANQPWFGQGAQSITGVAATSGAAQALALAVLAGTFLAGWLRGWGSRLVALLVAAVGVLAALVPAAPVAGTLGDAAAPGGTWWQPAFRVAVVVGALAALSAAVLRPAQAVTPARPAATLDDWQALDAGIDPTTRTETGGEHPQRPEWDDAGHADKEPR